MREVPDALRSSGPHCPLATHPLRVEQRPHCWHTPPSKEGSVIPDGHKDIWAGVLLTALIVGLLLGGRLVLRLTVY
jgi:hypothetical protein